MAVTQNSYTGNGSTTNYAFTFPYLKSSEVKAQIDATVTTAFTLANATTVQFNSAPANGAKIKIYRETDTDSLAATFYAGSAIKSEDLNDNFTQNLHTTQEVNARYLSNLGGTMVGDMTMAEDVDIVFEGATDDAYETTLTVADPTADRTITLPNVTGTVITTGDTGTVTATMLADNSVNTAELVNSAVTTGKINTSAVTTAKIADDAVTGAKIADDQINSEHYVDASIDTAHIADSQITTAKIATDAITQAKIADDAVGADQLASNSVVSASIVDGTIVAGDIASNAITNAKMADDSVGADELIDSSVNTAALATNAVTLAKMADSSVGTSELVDTSVTNAKLATDAVTNAKVANDAINTAEIVDNAVTTAKIADAELTTLAGMQSATASILASGTALTATNSEINTICDGKTVQTTISDTDASYPTSGAVVDYVAAQIAPLGGLEVIANEDSFPTQPASGVVVSIADAGGIVVNGSGVSTTARTSGNGSDNVTINGFPSSLYSTTLAANMGLMVSSTGSSNTYTYHKLLGKEDDIKQLSDDINDFAARYRVASSAPSSSLDNGDLWYDTSNAKMMVYNATASAWEEVTSTGDFYINTISSYSGTGGNSATFNGSAYRFVLSNPPQAAQQLIVSVNGVLQKPNSGTGQPSEGFALNGSSIVFSSAPATSSPYFIITVGSTVAIGTPSDNTVSTAKIQNLAVTTDKIAADAVTAAKIADDAVGAEHIEVLDANLQFADNAKAQFGTTDNDLEIYHDGSHSYLDNNTGWMHLFSDNFAIKDTGGGDAMIYCLHDGAVELYYDGSKKAETYSGGFKFLADVWFDNNTTAGRDIFWDSSEGQMRFYDYATLALGSDDDLKLFHSGAHSHVQHSGTGNLYIDAIGASVNLRSGDNAGGTHPAVVCNMNTSVDLYYDNVKKFETSSDGTTTTGNATFAGTVCPSATDTYSLGYSSQRWENIYMNNDMFIKDSGRICFGDSNDFQLTHDGSHSYITDAGTGFLIIKGSEVQIQSDGGEDQAKFIGDGAVELYHDGSKRFETYANGCIVTGELHVSSHLVMEDDDEIKIGNSADLTIRHDGTSNIFTSTNGSMIRFFQPNSINTTIYDSGTLSVYANSVSDYGLQIHNDGANTNRHGLRIFCGSDDAAGTNYAISIGDGNGTNQGYVTFSGGTVTYGTFTAYHPCIVPDADNPSDSSNAYPYGTLLETISIEYTQKDGANTERGIRYKVQKTQSANSRKVLGAYGSSMNGGPDGQTNEHQALVLGDGHILVNNAGGNIEVGDGICSSATAGIGQKATANPSMIIGIAQEAVTFTGSETKLVAVQYGLQQFIPWT